MDVLCVPKLSAGAEAFVLKIEVQPSNAVEQGQKLLVLQSAGELIEIQSPCAGVVEDIEAKPGQLVEQGRRLLSIGRQKSEKDGKNARKEDKMPKKTSKSGSVTPILMPQAGQSMEEGTIISWLVSQGDTVQIGQVICEIETDKATMEVESTHAGRIGRIVAAEGDIVEVKQPIAFLADSDEDVQEYLARATEACGESESAERAPAGAPTIEKPAGQESTAQAPVSSQGRVKASPAARKLARAKGVELSMIAGGSGPGGRIISRDVEGAQAGSAGTGQARLTELSKMRRAIAQNLLWSKQNVPHFYTKITVLADELMAVYRRSKESFQCSINDFVTRACALIVAQMPAFRSQYTPEGIIEQPFANIGIAVGTDNGLTVPVVAGADKLSFSELAAKSRDVAAAARAGKLEGVGQGVFTISNLGMFGVEEFSAIINPPESAILSVGTVREDVIVSNGSMRCGLVMTMVLSADHRVIDGMAAGQFASKIKELLENPDQLL